GRNVRVIAAITRSLEHILRRVAGESSVYVGRHSVIAEVILLVWFIPITNSDLEILSYMARNGNIHVLAPYHGIGIGIRPCVKDRICANREWVYGGDPVAGKGKRIRKIQLPLFQLSFLRRGVAAEFKTVQPVPAGTLPGTSHRVLRQSYPNEPTWRGRRIWRQL